MINTTVKKVIALYEQKRYVHPPLSEIAKKVGVSKARVWEIINEYKTQNKAFGLEK